MSLAAIAKSAVVIAFNAAGDAIKGTTYTKKGATSYDPVTGTTSTDSDHPIRMLVESASNRDKESFDYDKSLVQGSGSLKAKLIADELGFVPKTQDLVLIGTQRYIIAGFKQGDPVTATYDLLLVEPI